MKKNKRNETPFFYEKKIIEFIQVLIGLFMLYISNYLNNVDGPN